MTRTLRMRQAQLLAARMRQAQLLAANLFLK